MKPRDCPKFDACNAPICPMDEQHLQSCHRDKERTCFYLLEFAKPAALPILGASLPGDMMEAIAQAAPAIASRYGGIRRAMERASHNPPRIGRKPGA